jgi:hypothetical protein
MKHLSALLLFAFVCTASAQTVKTLGYNTTNGHVVYSGTNALTFTNAFTVATNAVATVRTNLGLGSTAQTIFKVMTNDLSITNQTNATTITDLTFDTAPNARYVVTANPVFDGSSYFQFVSTNATIVGQWNITGTLGFGSTNPLTNEIAGGTTGTTRSLLQVFYVLGGTNAGSVSLTFRSVTATNTNTIKAGSFLRADLMPQ